MSRRDSRGGDSRLESKEALEQEVRVACRLDFPSRVRIVARPALARQASSARARSARDVEISPKIASSPTTRPAPDPRLTRASLSTTGTTAGVLG